MNDAKDLKYDIMRGISVSTPDASTFEGPV